MLITWHCLKRSSVVVLISVLLDGCCVLPRLFHETTFFSCGWQSKKYPPRVRPRCSCRFACTTVRRRRSSSSTRPARRSRSRTATRWRTRCSSSCPSSRSPSTATWRRKTNCSRTTRNCSSSTSTSSFLRFFKQLSTRFYFPLLLSCACRVFDADFFIISHIDIFNRFIFHFRPVRTVQ